MHPVLVHIGFVTIYTYGLFVALGILAALWMGTYEAQKRGITKEQVMDMAFYAILCGFAGARGLFVAINPSLFYGRWLDVFKIWEGGLVFYGGLIGALLAVAFYVYRHNLKPGAVLDVIAVCAPLGHAIGRMGCFFAGCCYGRICTLPWAVRFTNPQTLARPIGVPLHPTQLYSVLANLTIFAILFTMSRRAKCSGRLFLVYILIYGLARSFIEIFRNDPRGSVFGGMLSTSQAIGLTAAVISAAVLVVLYLRDRSKKTDG